LGSHPSCDSQEKTTAAAVIFSLFRGLGLLQITPTGQVEAVSEKAYALIKSIGLSLEQTTPILGDWRAEGQKNPESQKLLTTLSSLEEYRFAKQGATAKASREIEAAIVLIKSKYRGSDRYLMQHSSAWDENDYLWFLGGIKETSDNSMLDCAYRELSEELGLERSMITSLSILTEVSDRRISRRVGCLTDYKYSIFSVGLNPHEALIKDIHKKEFSHNRSVSWASHNQENKWVTSSELLNSEELQRDAAGILDGLKSFGLDAVPYSSNLKIKSS